MAIVPKRRSKYNNVPLGLVLGLLVPLVVFVIIWAVSDHGGASLTAFYIGLQKGKILTNIISLCALANLLLFFAFIRKHSYYSARGVIMAVFIIVLWVLYTKAV